jgi:hypothetical protein
MTSVQPTVLTRGEWCHRVTGAQKNKKEHSYVMIPYWHSLQNLTTDFEIDLVTYIDTKISTLKLFMVTHKITSIKIRTISLLL